MSTEYRINDAIRAREVRLIDEKGKQVGIVQTRDALASAEERDLDLVEVAPNANPPVCRLMDFGKFLYEQNKKQREARKAQKTVEVKEMRFRPKTGEHDINFKLKLVRDFLGDGSKVKIRVVFRGREIYHPELGTEIMSQVTERLKDVAVVDQEPRLEGRSLLMILAPAK
ncbi:MAG: translation initiation factor IF-3 [Chloroflexi bacterium]|nr:translation initiation factor IF-3 [Chloroflexota bacterium]